MSAESASISAAVIAMLGAGLAAVAKLIHGLSESITSRAKADAEQIKALLSDNARIHLETQRLHARIDELEAQLAAKDARIAELERRLATIGEAGA